MQSLYVQENLENYHYNAFYISTNILAVHNGFGKQGHLETMGETQSKHGMCSILLLTEDACFGQAMNPTVFYNEIFIIPKPMRNTIANLSGVASSRLGKTVDRLHVWLWQAETSQVPRDCLVTTQTLKNSFPAAVLAGAAEVFREQWRKPSWSHGDLHWSAFCLRLQMSSTFIGIDSEKGQREPRRISKIAFSWPNCFCSMSPMSLTREAPLWSV